MLAAESPYRLSTYALSLPWYTNFANGATVIRLAQVRHRVSPRRVV